MQFGEVALFASKAKINVFEFFFDWRCLEGACILLKKFQKILAAFLGNRYLLQIFPFLEI